jgi:DNA-directed RNA polymerase specialized sigma24 family protein
MSKHVYLSKISVDDENIIAFEEEQFNEVFQKELDKILTKREKSLFLLRLNKVPYKELSLRFGLSVGHLQLLYRQAVNKIRQKIDLDSF